MKNNQLKTLVLFSLIFTLLFSVTVTVFAEENTISPRYSYTANITAGLSFSGGTANCSGSVLPSGSYYATITVTLYRKNGSSWDYVTSWYGSASNGNSAFASGSVYVGSGTFKVVAKGNIGNGLERPTNTVIRSN